MARFGVVKMIEAMALALSLVFGAHDAMVEANEAARYEQLALMEQQRQAALDDAAGEWDGEYGEWDNQWTEWDTSYYEWDTSYYEPSYDAPDLRRDGKVEANGTTFKWYSENVLPGAGLTDLNSNGRHVGEGGFVMDGDGYIAVASQDAVGTVVDTPWGAAKVYDWCETAGVTDVYVSW